MHRIVPELIVENYRAKKYHGSFRAVGMFLDLSGFSTLTDALMKEGQHGAEVLVGLMHNIFDPVVTSIFEHGGKIVGFAGDGIMALFPVQVNDRATALNALASAWWIQQSLAERSLKQTGYGSFSFSAKIGLSLGDVTWGILRSRDEKSATYYFRGAVVDDSANAEHLARPGDIYLARSIGDALSGDVHLGDGASFRRLAGIVSDLPGASSVQLPPLDEAVSRVFIPENILLRDERGEFRQAVNLFMRFPELPDSALQDFIHILFELQAKYGGMVDRLDFGDKGCNMLMLWGAPVAYENDIGRALNFVLDLKSRVDFPITAGVTYYIAHAGFLGGEMSECYTCYGWGVNLASRFMTSAPKGHIWIDERVARRIKNRFDYEYFGAQKFKGFETEQKVLTLLGRKPHIETPHQGEFVGRESELTRLHGFLEPLWRKEFAGVFGIWGEAGIGKSRLVYELSVSPALAKRDLLWAFCHSDQILRHSFNPFRYWLLRYFGLAPGMTDETRKRIFNARVDELIAGLNDPDLAAELDRTRSALGSLLDLEWPDSLYERLDAESRYNNTVLAIIALLKAECLRQPMVLFIEDAQFIDEDSLALLPRLKRALSSGPVSYPIAILLSSRKSGAEELFGDDLFTDSMELGALSARALASLAEIQLGGTVSPELVQLVQERSEGNPFFVEQVLVYLQEEKFIEMSAQGWRMTRRLQESSLPADIRALLVARLDQLDAGVRDAIQTASVLGREFHVPLLASMMAGRPSLASDLAVAERVEILLPLGRDHVAFTHGLLRDSAYSMQMLSRRKELHAQAVSALESLFSEELEYHFGELAYHAERAELTEKALHYLALSGDQAMSEFQNAQALDYFTRALAFTPETDLRSRWDFLFKRMSIYKRTGDRLNHLQDIEILDALAKRIGDERLTLEMLIQISYYQFTTGEYSHSLKTASKALENPKLDEQARMDAYSYWISSLLRLGRLDESMEKSREALALAREGGSRKAEALTLNGMGLISIEQTKLAQAMEYLNQSLDIARQIGDVFIQTSALNNMGNAAGYLGDYSMARDCYERSYLSMRERGDRYGQGLVLGNLGWIAGMQGDFSSAINYQQQALTIAREVGNPYQEAYTLINMSAVAGIQNNASIALAYARSGYELCRAIGERSGEAWSLLNMGHAYLLEEELEQAQTAYEQSLAIREEMHQPNLAAEALSGLTHIALQRDDTLSLAQRTESILSIMDIDREFSGAEDPLRIYFTLYQALEKMKDLRARVVLRNAKQQLEAQVSKFKDEAERQRYVENVPWRLALQQATQALD